jgi:NMD protein affecting ribosome stability and mRNA decay
LSKTFAFIKRKVTEDEGAMILEMSHNDASQLIDELVSLFKEVIRERARLVN